MCSRLDASLEAPEVDEADGGRLVEGIAAVVGRKGLNVERLLGLAANDDSAPAGPELPPMVRAVVAPAWREAGAKALATLDGITVEQLARKAAQAGLAPEPDVPITYAI